MIYHKVLQEKHPIMDQHDITYRRSWYYENLKNRKSLLIACGDSWTWGDSICGIDTLEGIIDHPDRNKFNYGGLLSEKLNSDYINLSQCGTSNEHIIKGLEVLLSQCVNDYQEIVVVFTMTENFRELGLNHPWVPTQHSTLDELFSGYERNMFLVISEIIDKFHKVKFLIARNFTYSHKENIDLLKGNHLSKTWVDCLYENQTIFSYPTETRFVSGMALEPLNDFIRENNFLEKYDKQYYKFFVAAQLASKWLYKSELNYNKATKHPTERGHEIWADYLYQEILSNSSIV